MTCVRRLPASDTSVPARRPDAPAEAVKRAVDGLLTLRDGTIDPVPGDERVLSRDLAALEGDRIPEWMAPAVAEALADPAALAAVRTLVDPPEPEPEPQPEPEPAE